MKAQLRTDAAAATRSEIQRGVVVLDFAFQFLAWADEPGRLVTPRTIAARFGVSRATAYRYLAAWRAHLSRRGQACARS